MRLTDLDARFIYAADAVGCRLSERDSVEGAQGVMFQCPACASGEESGEENGRRFVRGAHYVRVFFSNPIGAPVAPPEADENPRWAMSESSLADLTLSPSINCDIGAEPRSCRWHGYVRNGDAA